MGHPLIPMSRWRDINLKLQPATLKEVKRISTGVLLGSGIMVLVWSLVSGFDWSVLLGALLGSAAAIGNFLYLGISVQKAAAADETKAKLIMRSSYTTRMLLSVVVMILGFAVPIFQWMAVVIPLFLPRLTIVALQITGAYKPSKINESEGE